MMWTAEPVAAVPPDDVELADAVELAGVAEPPDDDEALLQAEATAARKASAAADATTRGAGPLRLPWVCGFLLIATFRPLRCGALTGGLPFCALPNNECTIF
jgi:hypothetical protein